MGQFNIIKEQKTILITIDVEDWFQVENFKPWIPYSSWDKSELRVETNTHKLLDLFDALGNSDKKGGSSNNSNLKIQGTFFFLGWIAKRLPELVREIKKRGHEIASHGYNHNRCNTETRAQLFNDLTRSKKLLEDIIGGPVSGYRAPNFSINDDVLNIIEKCGYLYDSSYNSFDKHDRYGKITTKHFQYKNGAFKISNTFYELPISNLKTRYKKVVLPWGGGGYFRLIPNLVFNMGIRSILKSDSPYMFYIHPWEIDPSQPRVTKASPTYRFRHYVNLKRTEKKLIGLVKHFQRSEFITCGQYISKIKDKDFSKII